MLASLLTLQGTTANSAETSTQVIAVSVGPLKGCQASSTDVYCWGKTFSELISQDAMPGDSIPSRVIFPREQQGIKILDLVVGTGFACALFVNNKVYCWGGNIYGVLGAGSNITTSITPVNIDQTGVLKGKTITDIAASGLTACVIASGAPFCWGSGNRGQLGNGNLGIAFSPSAVLASGVLSGKIAASIFAGDSGGSSGGVFCVITDLGAGFCWGGKDSASGYGSPIGDGNQFGSYYPVAINMSGDLLGKKITYISPGMCLVADEQLFCWGSIQKFFTARFGRVAVYSPTLVSNDATLVGKKITAVEADFIGGCVIADNDLLCWGDRFSDTSTGYNGLRLPRKIPLPNLPKGQILEKINQTSQNRYCLIASGQSACLGLNSNGELGNGTTVASWIPTAVNTKALLSAAAEKILEEAKFVAEEMAAKAAAEEARRVAKIAEDDAKKEALKLIADRKVTGFKPAPISSNDIYYDGTEVATAGARFIAYVDTNKDLKSDLITISDTCSGAVLRFGNFFKSTFSTPTSIFENLKTCHLVSGDYNKDGIVDFVLTQGETIEIIVLLGKADGTFVVSSRYQVGYSLFNFEIFQKDLNLDGNLDLIKINDYSKSIHIFLGQGNGEFKKLDEVKFLNTPNHLTLLDINGDKYPELIINLFDSSKVLLLNTKQGTSFIPTILNDLPEGMMQAGDFDGDSEDDLVIFDYFSSKVSIAWGLKSSSSFALGDLNSYFYQPRSVSVADINLDGLQDFVVTGGNGVVPYYAVPGRKFQVGEKISSNSSQSTILADVDFKLGLDLVVSQLDGRVFLYLQKGPPPILDSPKFSMARDGDSSDTLILTIEKVVGTSSYLISSPYFTKTVNCTLPKCEVGIVSDSLSNLQTITLRAISTDRNSYLDSNPTQSTLARFVSAAEKAAAELKAKQEAESKLAAEKSAAELKAKQEAEAKAKAAADKAAAELKTKQEAELKATAELKAKQDAEEAAAKVAAELKAKQEADAKAAANKKTTITCIKGKLIKKVTAVKPKCPTGYKLKN